MDIGPFTAIYHKDQTNMDTPLAIKHATQEQYFYVLAFAVVRLFQYILKLAKIIFGRKQGQKQKLEFSFDFNRYR